MIFQVHPSLPLFHPAERAVLESLLEVKEWLIIINVFIINLFCN